MVQRPKDDSTSNIYTIPDDILLVIFLIASHSPPSDKSPPTPVIISTVCSRWRRLAVDYPLLWTDIRIPSYPACDIGLFFNRSQPAEIDVALDITENGTIVHYSLYPRISQLVKANIDRLRSLHVLVPTTAEVEKFFEPFQDDIAPVLQKMEVMLLFNEVVYGPSNTLSRRILNGSPGLQFLKLRGISVDSLPPTINLTSLDIAEYCPTSKQFQELFLACPNITRLILRRFGAYLNAEDDESQTVIEVSSLRCLVISFDSSHPYVGCTCPITYLATPNLNYLEIHNHFSSSLQLLAHLSGIVGSWPQGSSRTVRLDKVAFPHCLHLLQNLPRSTNLELTSVISEGLPQVLSLPNFKSITLDLNTIPGCKWGEIFSQVVAISCPLVLHVPPCSSSDPQLIKAAAIHQNISLTTTACCEGIMQEGTNSYDDDYVEDPVLSDYDFEDDYDYELEFEDEYDDYHDDEYLDFEEYDEFEDDGLEDVVSYNVPI